jgi:hypothetical protein
MATEGKDARSRAEQKFSQTRKTDETAKGMVEAERKAVREKTARLRAQRLNGDSETATEQREPSR